MTPLTLSLMPLLKRMTRKLTRRSKRTDRVRTEQEMMIMRETDQWMCEHYATRS